MKTIKINLYKFEELSKEVQQKVIDENRDINFFDNWWEAEYEDAKIIGLKIDEFDLDRNRHAKGEFIDSAYDCAIKIIENHGKDCETFKTASKFIVEYEKLSQLAGDDTNPFNKDVANADDLADEFLKDILEDYSIILQNQYEYLSSDEAVIETIEINEFTFEEDGIMRNE